MQKYEREIKARNRDELSFVAEKLEVDGFPVRILLEKREV